MPKSRKAVKHTYGIRKYWSRPSFRIGTRKNGKSAHLYSTKELFEMLLDASKKRWHSKINNVLTLRGALKV